MVQTQLKETNEWELPKRINLVLVRYFCIKLNALLIILNKVKLSVERRNAIENAKLDGPFSCNMSQIFIHL